MNDEGFVHLKDQINVADIENVLFDIYKMQANKLTYFYGSSWDDLAQLIEDMEAKGDYEALYQVQKLIPYSLPIRQAFAPLVELCAESILHTPPNLTLLEGPGLFINRPRTGRLLYKWHSEAHYYPKRRNFVNVWMPLFANKTLANGAMSLKLGSHKRDFPFVEYSSGKNAFIQYEILPYMLHGFMEHVCESKRGDVILFDRALVHRSNENKSEDYSFAAVARIWCPWKDLTIAGKMEVTPYGGDIGHPSMVVGSE